MSLTSHGNVEGKIIGGIKGFFGVMKASIYEQNIVKVSFTVDLACSSKNCLSHLAE